MIVMRAKAILRMSFLIVHNRGSKYSYSGALSWIITDIISDVADYLARQW